MDDRELLKALYRAVDWDRFYRLAPHVSREQVEDLFQRISSALKNAPEAAPAGPVLLREARLHCDGASSGNPGPAGIGMVLSLPDGAEIEAWGMPIGRATNNLAEYRALVEGLRRALELGVREIEVVSDSQLLVRQITGRYKVKNAALAGLHQVARGLLDRFERWAARHVCREENKTADRIARAQVKKPGKAKG